MFVARNMKSALTVLHLGASASYFYSSVHVMYVALTTPEKYKDIEFLKVGREYMAYFLCLWLLIIHQIYFGAYAWISIAEMKPKTESRQKTIDFLHKLGSYLLFSIVFPFAVVITVLFWSLYYFYKEKMYPSVVNEVAPFHLQHFCHTLPLPLCILYMITSNKYVPSKIHTFLILIVMHLSYTFMFMHYRSISGRWLYFVFDITTPFETAALLTFGFVGPIIFFFLGYDLYSLINMCFRSKSLKSQKKHS